MSENKILLTGAGFTHNFGLPLATDVWGMIFNHRDTKNLKKIRKALLKEDQAEHNYERIYTEVLKNERYAEEKEQFLKIIDNIFNKTFEELCVNAISQEQIHSVSFQYLREFIKKFAGSYKNSLRYLFTLNQDLFLERLFLKDEDKKINRLISPYIGSCLYPCFGAVENDYAVDKTLQQLKSDSKWEGNIDGRMLNDEQLSKRKIDLKLAERLLREKLPFYFKLHGSIGWYYSESDDKKIPIVMGEFKKDTIDGEPIFKEYFEIFRKALSMGNVSLLTIGYSFSDKHINEVIIEAINSSGLRLHIINPKNLFAFLKDLKELKSKSIGKAHYKAMADCICQGLDGYYQGTLKDIFPLSNHKEVNLSYNNTHLWNQLKENFFEE